MVTLHTNGAPELTNQDSEGGKNFTVLTSITKMYVNRKGIEFRQLFSLDMALLFLEKGFAILVSHCEN